MKYVVKETLVQFTLKKSALYLPNVRTTHDNSDSASQTINFFQAHLALAYFF